MAAAPVSSATEHAAEVIERLRERLCDGDGVRVDHIESDLIDAIAEIERLTGLLCTPQERAVINAALTYVARRLAEWDRRQRQVTNIAAEMKLSDSWTALRAAVDRLAATGPKEAT